jgi:glycosyltransferase involved in cell wall biosynthesis
MVIAVSRHLAGTIQSRIGNAVAVRIVPYGLDLNRFQGSADRAALRRALDLTPDQPVAIMVARLEAPKDYPLLIAAAQLVCRAVPDCVFLAVGDGSQRAALAAMAEQAGLGRSVRFLGARSDVPELLQLADIGVLTSRREGLPLAILEYMASGKPVVASAVGGVGEMVHDGLEGYLLRSARAEECAGRILQLLRDPAQARAMGARGRALVERQFSLSTMVQTYSALYHHLAATNRDARPAATP